MRPETRALVYNQTIGEVCEALDLSARAAAALVEDGTVDAILTRHGLDAPALDDVRFRGDQVVRLTRAEKVLSLLRERFPQRTRDYDRATALGALLGVLR